MVAQIPENYQQNCKGQRQSQVIQHLLTYLYSSHATLENALIAKTNLN